MPGVFGPVAVAMPGAGADGANREFRKITESRVHVAPQIVLNPLTAGAASRVNSILPQHGQGSWATD